jgi:hypothetical protein
MELKEELKKFVAEQFLTDERVKKEIKTILPFFKEMQVPVTAKNTDIFLTHLKDSIVASLILYAEENKINVDN